MNLSALSLTGAALWAIGITGWESTASAAPDRASGEMLFRQRCQSCHMPGRPSPLGPSLTGVVGRKAGTTPFNYSAAMKRSGLTWTQANLERYLASPIRMVPGTRMVVSVPDATQRKALIEYLAKTR